MLVPDLGGEVGESGQPFDLSASPSSPSSTEPTAYRSALMGTPGGICCPNSARRCGASMKDRRRWGDAVRAATGRPPFLGEVVQHLYAAPPPLASLVPNVSPAIAQLVARLFEKERQPRAEHDDGSLRELQEQLSQCREQDLFCALCAAGVRTHTAAEHSTLGSSATAAVRKRVPLC